MDKLRLSTLFAVFFLIGTAAFIPTEVFAKTSTNLNLDLGQSGVQNNNVFRRSLFFASPDRPNRLGPDGIGTFVDNASVTIPFSLPQSGDYKVVITYGLLERKAPLSIKIDGTSPSSWQSATLWPSTVNYSWGSSRKLYGHNNDHLRIWTVSANSKTLSAGNHTITLEFPQFRDLVITNIELTDGTTPVNSETPWLFDKYVEFPALEFTSRTISGSSSQPTITFNGVFQNLESHRVSFTVKTSVMPRAETNQSLFEVMSVEPLGTLNLNPGEKRNFTLTAQAKSPVPDAIYSELIRLDLESIDVPKLSRPYFMATGQKSLDTNPTANIYFKGADARDFAVQAGTNPQYVIPNRNTFNIANGKPTNTIHEAFLQALASAPDNNPVLSVPNNGGYVFNFTKWAKAGAPSEWYRTHVSNGTTQPVSFKHNGEASFGRRHMLTKIFDGQWQKNLNQLKDMIMFLSQEMPYYNPYGRWDSFPGYLPVRQYEYGGTVTMSSYVKLLQAGMISDEEHFRVLHNVILPLYAAYRDDLRQYGTLAANITAGSVQVPINRAVPDEMYPTDFLPISINGWFKIGTGENASYVRRASGSGGSTNRIDLRTTSPGVLNRDYQTGEPWTAYRMREWTELEATDIWSFLALAVASRDPAVYETAAERIEVIYKTQNIYREDGSFGNEPGSYGWGAYLYMDAYNEIKNFLGDSITLPTFLDQQMLDTLTMWLNFPFSNGYHPMLNGGGSVNQLPRLGYSRADGPKDIRLLRQMFPERTDLISKYENIINQEKNRTPGSVVDNESFKVDWWGYAMLRGPGSWDKRMETLLSSKRLKFNPGDHVSNDALGLALYAHGSIMTPRYGYHWIGYPALLLNRVSIDRTNPSIWGDFYHFDDNEELPSAIAYTDMSGSNSTTPGIAHQERWNIQLPEYLFDAYFVKPQDGATHRFEWGFRNLGELDIVNPSVTLTPATEADGLPWDPFGYYRSNTGREGMGFTTDNSWQAEWTMNENSIIHSPSSDAGNPNKPNNYPLPGSKMRLIMTGNPGTKVTTAWLTGPGRNDSVNLRQDFITVERKGTEAVFINTIEPVADTPFVQSVKEVAVHSDGSRSVKVTTAKGTDWFLVGNKNYNAQPNTRRVGPFTTDAKLAMVRVEGGKVKRVMFSKGSGLEFSQDNVSLTLSNPNGGIFHLPETGEILGDINSDGVVNILDYTLLSNAFGTSDPVSDVNSDGTVNILDYTILSNNFGASS